MTDVHSPTIRSYNMSRIKGKNTKPEMLVRKFLFSEGYRYRLNVKSLPGKPDIVIRKLNTVIFIHGCYWHGHEGCRYFVVPKTRTDWWVSKITRNVENDKLNQAKLSEEGWRIIILWECMLKPKTRENTLAHLITELKM
ncbi:MAG: DNA mismatch endonuclease patch repair [Bacteroidetes bacterium]|nr:MAG: DNA mismatch endonuclease patch repair [Bacteroidota bacterium]